MISDQEVAELYRCLLGRAPENANTIKAFQNYYPNIERGRKAVFDSNEFQAFYASVTGRDPYGAENTASGLALALLARAGAIMPAPPHIDTSDPILHAGMRTILGTMPKARLAVAIGESPTTSLDDLIPFDRSDAAILQIAANFPPVVPLTSTLAGGATLFRMAMESSALATFLESLGRRIDALYLLGRPAGLDWIAELRGRFATQTLLVIDKPREHFPADQLSIALQTAGWSEPAQNFQGLRLHHIGGWLLPVSYAPPAAPPCAPDKAAHPRLALAAILRNEAVCVENMLRSVLPIASYVALLDTGSTDRTIPIAKSVLAKSGIGFEIKQKPHEAFNDDFSAMRNAAIDMVPDDIDWVLMLDADEELVPEDYAAILKLAASGAADAYALPRYNFPGSDKQGQVLLYPDRQTRMLRHTKDRRVRYAGAVHETVAGTPAERPPLDASALGGPRGGPHIHHLVRRFRTPEQEERKQEFYRAIARRGGAGAS